MRSLHMYDFASGIQKDRHRHCVCANEDSRSA
jgi:hypothetical protein